MNRGFWNSTSYAILLMSTAAAIISDKAGAQPVGETAQHADRDIVVTARKREETLISVPVAVTAVTAAQLEQRGVNSIDGLARLVPQLIVGEGGGTIQGGNIVLRGISGADSNPFADQAVSFNIDGVQIARASVRRMAEMDVAQVEVLKGPQALFYGKNSPGGVISIRSADPTSSWTGKIASSYEMEAREFRGDGFISGPLTDSLGFRLAAYGSTMKGWVKSQIPANAPLQPAHARSPEQNEFAVRGTLKFDASDSFDARLKFTFSKRTGDSSAANLQFVDCPLGGPQTGGVDDCRANGTVSSADAGANFAGLDPSFDGRGTFLTQKQVLTGLEMNYRPSDTITLTSVTGYYSTSLDSVGNFTASYVPSTYIHGRNYLSIDEFSQELRVTSDFDGPFNFTTGGHFQDSRVKSGAHSFLNANAPVEILEYLLKQDGLGYSAFAQGTFDILPTLEISAGGRYSHERKKLPFIGTDTTRNPSNPLIEQTAIVAKRSFNNFSPEFTLSWRPSKDMTVYGSYKKGFLSGGFNSGAANFATNLSYDQQLIKGFEGGAKVALLDGTLHANLALYSYRVTGLQVTVTTGGGTVQELRNAGKVSSKGIEFDFSYRPPVDGLRIDGALSYNRGRYLDYQATCYRGQNANSPVPCLNQLNRVSGNMALLQDLSGTELLRAPEFAGNLSADYHVAVGNGLELGLGADMTYSDSYLTDASSKAAGRSPSYALLGASVRLGQQDNGWQVALIGRNLTNKYFWTRSIDNPFSGTPASGGTTAGVLGDTVGPITRGRELMLRLSYSFR